MKERIGFMQGRLVDKVNGRIQAFPFDQWRDEFVIANELGIYNIEWTIDADRIEENPIYTNSGRREILHLSERYNIKIRTLTGDLFMQMPFWKEKRKSVQNALLSQFDEVLKCCSHLNIKIVVVPLVDNGKLETPDQASVLLNQLLLRYDYLRKNKIRLAFESDFDPMHLSNFMNNLPPDIFGVNYDIGNSASLGFDPNKEFSCYGSRVINVHMKDRKYQGSTVPLGTGDAKFDVVFHNLNTYKYDGLIVLQTARAENGNHAGVLKEYFDLTLLYMEKHFES